MNQESNNRDNGSVAYLVLICLVAALGGLLFGYDTGVISGAIGFLRQVFVAPLGLGVDQANALVGWTASSAIAGCMVGAAFAGKLADAFGRKKILILSAILFLISALGSAMPEAMNIFVVADSLASFIIYRILGGIGVGMASMTSPMYIAEITPAKWRGRMVSVNQFAIISGMLVVYFINMYIAGRGDDAWDLARGWRWMFGSECIPATSLLLLAFLIPESPRWLAKMGRSDEATTVLQKVGGATSAKKEMAEISAALDHEAAKLSELFKPGMFMVLVIGVVLAVMQQITGINVVLYFGPQIFQSLGSGQDVSFMQQVIVGAVNLTFTIVAIWTVDKVGRKPLMLVGAAGMGLCMFVQGGVAVLRLEPARWMLLPILGYIACFALSLGPIVWVYLSEIFPTKIRGRAMSIATLSLWFACWLVSQTFPMMDSNPFLVEKFNHGFPFFLYGVFCVVTFVFVAKCVPETKGKTLEEIEQHWGKA